MERKTSYHVVEITSNSSGAVAGDSVCTSVRPVLVTRDADGHFEKTG